MAVTTVDAQHGFTGKAAFDYRISLSFTGGIGRLTETEITDNFDIARIEHATV